jgi:hypothetical protein
MKNLDTVLPFYQTNVSSYDFLIQQNRFKEYVVEDCMLICFTDRLLPFVIRRQHTAGTLANLTFYLEWEGQDIPCTLDKSKLTLNSSSYTDDIVYDGLTAFSTPLHRGRCWIRILDSFPTDHVVYYSETMNILPVEEKLKYTRVDFSNTTELNGIRANFNQVIYIDNLLKTPDFLRTDAGEKIDEIFIPEKRIAQKVCNLQMLLVPEYTIDSLITLPMMDTVKVTEVVTGETWYPQEVRLKDPAWVADDYGATASMAIQLVRKTIIKKLSYVDTQISQVMGKSVDSLTITLIADTPKDATWGTPFASSQYDYTLTAYDSRKNPVFPSVTAQTSTKLTLVAQVDCTVSIIAVGDK